MARSKGRRPNRGRPGKSKYKHLKNDNDTGAKKEEGIELEGIVVEKLPNAQFTVRLKDTDSDILAYVSGKMRKHWIRILTGDKVKVEVSPYDLTRARIVYRYRN